MNFVDGVLAFRIVQLLTTPFEDLDAYRLGLIDDEGKQLKKPQTEEEKRAWTLLTRVVVRVKRAMLYSSVAGSVASIAAAYWLVKECYTHRVLYTTESMVEQFEILAENAEEYLPLEEAVLVQSILNEDAPVNSTAGLPGEHEPVVTPAAARRYREFNVSTNTFNKFSRGKQKFARWATYLDTTNEEENNLYDYARRNPRGIIVLRCGDQQRAIRFNRRGGGRWHKIQRPARNLGESLYTTEGNEGRVEVDVLCGNINKL